MWLGIKRSLPWSSIQLCSPPSWKPTQSSSARWAFYWLNALLARLDEWAERHHCKNKANERGQEDGVGMQGRFLTRYNLVLANFYWNSCASELFCFNSILKQRRLTTQLSGVSCFGGHCVPVPRVLHGTIECCFIQWINFVLATFSVHPWNLSSLAQISIGVLKLRVLYFVLTIKRLRGLGISVDLSIFLWPAPHHPLPASSHKDNSLFLLIWLNGLFRPQWNCKFSVAVTFLQTTTTTVLPLSPSHNPVHSSSGKLSE